MPEGSACCPSAVESDPSGASCCPSEKQKFDWLLWGSLIPVAIGWLHTAFHPDSVGFNALYAIYATSVHELINTMWWGVAIGITMVGILGKVPREFVMSILGTKPGLTGVLRATAAGVLLDLCSHGILMVGAKLYERGASAGQLMAFLIASPWNSFSLTLVLVALIGLPWTLAFIVLSMLIAICVGLIFDQLERTGRIKANPATQQLPEDFEFWSSARLGLASTRFDRVFFSDLFWSGLKDSRMVIRWLLFGVLLAATIRMVMPADLFADYFGPTLLGLGLTMVAATIIEVCSEGSTPIAADLFTRAGSPGNSFAFLMTGVATDYTEIMVIKETTRSWRIAILLPLKSVPHVILVAVLLNVFVT